MSVATLSTEQQYVGLSLRTALAVYKSSHKSPNIFISDFDDGHRNRSKLKVIGMPRSHDL